MTTVPDEWPFATRSWLFCRVGSAWLPSSLMYALLVPVRTASGRPISHVRQVLDLWPGLEDGITVVMAVWNIRPMFVVASGVPLGM